MAICKALHENDVVLYHPLNDFVEQTQNQTWGGSTQFVAGAVGSGVSAINTFTAQLGTPVGLPGAVNFTTVKGKTKSNVIWLTDTLIAILYNISSNTTIRTASVSGTTITGFNTATNISTPVAGLAITKLTSSQFVIAYSQGGNRHLRAATVDSSGLVTLGPVSSIITSGILGHGGPSTRLDSTRFITSAVHVVGGFDSQYSMYVCQVNGSGTTATITIGPEQHVGTNGKRARNPAFAAWPSSIDNSIVSGVYFWEQMPSGTVILPNIIQATKFSVSGLTVTKGTTVNTNGLHEQRANGAMDLGFPNNAFALTDDVVIYNYTGFNGFGGQKRSEVLIGRVNPSGQLTFNDPILKSTTLGTAPKLDVHVAKVGKETDQSLDIHIHNLDTNAGSILISRPGSVPAISGGIQFGSGFPVYKFNTGSFDGVGPLSHFNSGDSRVFIGSETVNKVSGVIFGLGTTSNSILTSLDGSVYPSVATSTRITFGVWMRDTLMTGGSFKIGRSFEVTVNPTNIVLNPSGLTWNVSLSAILNDGNEHLLLLDFEHTIAGQWRLRTSIDGVTWTDRGLQLFGVLPVGIANTTPEITMDNTQLDLGRWIDEVIIWKDTPLFTDQELLNLHQLGSTLDSPQCDYLVHFPFLSSGNTTLAITGFVAPPEPTDPVPHSDFTTLAMFGDTQEHCEGDDQEDELHKLHNRLEGLEDLCQRHKKKRKKRRKRKKLRDKHKEKRDKNKD